jgi:hypothetical protein
MSLVRAALPLNAPTRSLPFDATMAFSPPAAPPTAPVTLTASGWLMGTPVAGSPSAPITLASQNFVNLGQPLSGAQAGAVSGLSTGSVFGTAGRVQGSWVLQVDSASLTSANEFYQFYLYGTNDASFGAGNCELLGSFDIAATAALRLGFPAGQASAFVGVAAGGGTNPVTGQPYFAGGNLANVSSPVPAPVFQSSTFVRPFSNESDVFTFQFCAVFVEMGGTSPSVTLNSWLVPAITGGPRI